MMSEWGPDTSESKGPLLQSSVTLNPIINFGRNGAIEITFRQLRRNILALPDNYSGEIIELTCF
jgi:hypothetical protein